MNDYINYLEKRRNLGFDKEMIDRFEKNVNILAAYFDNCLKHPFEVTEYYHFTKDGNASNNKNWWEVKTMVDSDYIADLKKLNIEKVVVLPIPFLEKSFILFFNSRNRIFLTKDIEMVYQAVRRMGLEMKNYYDNIRLKMRMNIISDMHIEVNELLKPENDFNRREYIKHFFEILAHAIEKLDVFENFIFWEYVSENFPEEKQDILSKESEDYVFRCVYSLNPNSHLEILDNNNSDFLNQDYVTIHLTKNEFNSKILNSTNNGTQLFPILSLRSGSKNKHFDTVVSTKSNKSLDGLISFICKDIQIMEDMDFINFIGFFSNQISIAWNKLLDNIILKIEDRIDKITLNTEYDAKKRMQNELIEITKILTDEFSCNMCCLLLKNEDTGALELETCNIPLFEENKLIYDPIKDKDTLSLKSLNRKQGYRIFGRTNTLKFTNKNKLFDIEKRFKNYKIKENEGNKFKNFIVEHWLSIVLTIGVDTLGLIKLYQIKSIDIEANPDVVQRPPFSKFESILLSQIQKHVFNILTKHRQIKNRQQITEQSIKKRRDYMQNMVHQVVAPLNALINHCVNLSRGYIPIHKMKSKLAYTSILARISASHAGGFQQILALEEGKIEVKKKTIFDLRLYWIEKAIDFQPLAKKKGITIHVKDASVDDKVSVAIDKDLFGHVAFNILDNAVKYSFKKRQRKEHKFKEDVLSNDAIENIQISVKDKGKEVEFKISNCGLEISAEDKDQVFNRNFRGKIAAEYSATGSGIGLYLVKKIITLHGGKINVIPSYHKNITIIQITLPKN